MTTILAYWDIRGLAQPIRLLLEYTGVKYENKFYSCGEAPYFDKSSWLDEKFKLGLDFPNLPYLVDRERRIVQSNAIMRYIARQHNMNCWKLSDLTAAFCHHYLLLASDLNLFPGENVHPKKVNPFDFGVTEDERIRVDILENQAMDFRNNFVRLCYSDFDGLKPGYLEMLPGTLQQFSQYLGDRKWFAGDKITFVDFIMYELLDQHRMFEPTCLNSFKNLKALLDRFESLEKIAAYMKSDRFIKTPVNNKSAKWGNSK